ncbi:(+)-neomenthol dehydrogenase-like [Papaver somniferum]|uniref:(+)-neomenthol dehydrogenase-like n=1 Tax=Papaver somniferum TaxID=3469 RepID=UPI000E70124C|nr:(+)-neomenthol dehydrogenase-like [Papaver somniferum]
MDSNTQTKIRCAVITGGNKGIGFEICRQLASSGISIALTSRDATKGLEAIEKIKISFGLSIIVFHQLDYIHIGGAMSALGYECLQTNYYGVKLVTEALIPLLQLYDSPRIVNVTSTMGMLKVVFNVNALEILSDGDGLKEESVDEMVNMFLKYFKEDLMESKGWPSCLPDHIISKASLDAYTRILTKQFPDFHINYVMVGSRQIFAL